MFSFLKRRRSKPVEQPALPKPLQIGCVAKQILNDLDIKNEGDWETKWMDGYSEMSCKGKLYVLRVNGGYISLKDVNEFSFNHDEMDAIEEKVRAIENIRYERSRKQRVEETNEIMKKLFPACYK
jgi:hypothetical protein